MKAIVVANARHDIQLASELRTLRYHERNFLAREERDRKWLTGRLAEMATSMEASKAREEEERREKERRRATIYEKHELNVDRSVADESAIQVMKKLIEAAMERPPEQRKHYDTAAATTDRSQMDSPGGDGSMSAKSRVSTAGKKKTEKLRSRQATRQQMSSTGLKQAAGASSSTTSLAASDHTASKKDLRR